VSALARRCAALLLLCLSPAWAQPVLDLAPGPSVLDLAPYLAMQVDPQAQARLADILATPGFAPPSPAALRPGYSASAYWLRFRLRNPSTQTQQRLLQVPPARLEEISLFVADGQGRWQRWDAGTATPFAQRSPPWRISTFALTLAPGQTQELLLRVASRSAITLRPRLWEPHALAARQQQELLGDGLMLGMMALLLLAALLLAGVLRERAYAYIALYLLCCMAYESGMRGTSFMLLWPNATDWAVRSLSSFGVLAMLMECLALSRMLGLRRSQPRLQRVLAGLALAQLIGLGWCLWGDYRLGSVLLSQVNTLAYLGMLMATWRAWRARHPLAKPWLGMLLAGMLGMLPRYAELLGWLPNTALSEYAPPLAGLLGSVLVLAGLLRRLQRQRARQGLRLELAVRERTLALDEARERAERSDMAKGRLLGYLGHDLRAPLASVVQVARQLSPDAEFEAGRRAIEHSSLLALEMIDEMQHFARDPQSEARLEILPAPLYLHGLLEDIVAQSQALARAGGNSLALRVAADLPAVVQLDARRLRQVLVNLLANAAKFTRGGRIVLEAGVADTAWLALAVRDNGPGIAPADLARVFEPYQRGPTEGFRPGIGLGLSIARQLVHAMAGEISVASRPGQGACFSLRLPRVDADEDEVQWPPARPWLSRPLGEGSLALLLDGSANARAALRERLVLAGFECLEAADRAEAEPLLSAQPIRLLVAEPALDPGWSAWLAAWQRRRPALAVLLCSRLHVPAAERPPRLLKPAAESEWWPALSGLLRHESGRT
jgi:signal transduction histidine kinase